MYLHVYTCVYMLQTCLYRFAHSFTGVKIPDDLQQQERGQSRWASSSLGACRHGTGWRGRALERRQRNMYVDGSPQSLNPSAAQLYNEAFKFKFKLSSMSAANWGAGAPVEPPEADRPPPIEELFPDE